MKKIYFFFFLILLPSLIYSQEFIESAEQNTQLDEHGNYLNNITDPNGMKQGDWFYIDINGKQIAKKVYDDNVCTLTSIMINSKWYDTKNLLTSLKIKNKLIHELNKKDITLNKNQQVLLILNKSGEFLNGRLIGKWSKEEEHNILSILKNHISTLDLKPTSKKTYILL